MLRCRLDNLSPSPSPLQATKPFTLTYGMRRRVRGVAQGEDGADQSWTAGSDVLHMLRCRLDNLSPSPSPLQATKPFTLTDGPRRSRRGVAHGEDGAHQSWTAGFDVLHTC